MYNLHSHSLLSDGVLLPSELAVRYAAAGFKVLAITDHADYSNIEMVVSSINNFVKKLPKDFPIKVLSGVELTHIPPEQFKPLVAYCRKNKIQVVIGHGETTVEPVLKGTNLAALEAGVDILAHPGMITDKEAQLAKKKQVFLEVTSRRGHNKTNSHVVAMALKYQAKLILNHDSHQPFDIISPEQTCSVGFNSGLSADHIAKIYQDINRFFLTNITRCDKKR